LAGIRRFAADSIVRSAFLSLPSVASGLQKKDNIPSDANKTAQDVYP
jgi:hypothetical protein